MAHLRNTALSEFFCKALLDIRKKFPTVNLINDRSKFLSSVSDSHPSFFQFPQTPRQMIFSALRQPLPSSKAPHDSQANECGLPHLPFQSCSDGTFNVNLNVHNLNQNELSSSSYQLNSVPLSRAKDLRCSCNLPWSHSQKAPHPLDMDSLYEASHIIRELLLMHKFISSTDRHSQDCGDWTFHFLHRPQYRALQPINEGMKFPGSDEGGLAFEHIQTS